MLYDPKWERKTKTDEISLAGFIAWLELQPADATFPYMPCRACAIGQYAASLGKSYHDTIKATSIHEITRWNAEITAIEPRTFGAALKRARSLHYSTS